MNLTILYSRTSTDQQDNSIQTQNVRSQAYLPSKGLFSISELVFDDADVSGSSAFWERPNGKVATDILRFGFDASQLSPTSAALIEAHGIVPGEGNRIPVKTIVFSKVDRMGRKAKHQLELLEWIERYGIELHIVDFFGDSFCNQSAMGKVIAKVMFGMCALFAELEVETIRHRIKDVFETKRGRGEICGLPAYGEMGVPSGRLTKRGTEILLSMPNEQEMPWLLRMMQWRAEGLSYHAIARQLNLMGVPPKHQAGTLLGCRAGGKRETSGQWSPGSVQHALTSRYAMTLSSESKTQETETAAANAA